jgi:hypothetical protein
VKEGRGRLLDVEKVEALVAYGVAGERNNSYCGAGRRNL